MWKSCLLLIFFSTGLLSEPRALIVVNVNYPDRRVASYADIETAKNVALSIGFREEQIKVVIDATRKAFRDAWKWLEEAGEDDPVLLYFDGEGALVPDQNGDEHDGYDEAIVMVDSDTSSAIIIDDDLQKLMERLKSKKKLVILDCCYAADKYSVLKGIYPRDSTGFDLMAFFTKKEMARFMAIVATRKEIPVPSKDEESIFTRALYEGLAKREADLNKDNMITPSEFVRYYSKYYKDTSGPFVNVSFLSCYNLLKFAHKESEYSIECLRNLFNARNYLFTMPSGVRYRFNETVRVTVRLPFDAYLYLFELDPGSNFKLIYPPLNELKSGFLNNYFRGGREVTISPGVTHLVAAPPRGESILIALATKKPITYPEIKQLGDPSGNVFLFHSGFVHNFISNLSAQRLTPQSYDITIIYTE